MYKITGRVLLDYMMDYLSGQKWPADKTREYMAHKKQVFDAYVAARIGKNK